MTYEKIMIFYDETYDFAQGFLMRFQGHYLSYCLFSLRGAIILQGGAIMPPPAESIVKRGPILPTTGYHIFTF